MRERGIVIASVQFEAEMVVVSYLEMTDVKANGAQRHQTLFIPREDDYDDEIEAVEEAVRYLLRDISEDWPVLKSAEEVKRKPLLEEQDDEDET